MCLTNFVIQNRILSSLEAQPCSGTSGAVYSETWKGLLMPGWNLVKNLVVADWRLVLAALAPNEYLLPGKCANNILQWSWSLLKCLYLIWSSYRGFSETHPLHWSHTSSWPLQLSLCLVFIDQLQLIVLSLLSLKIREMNRARCWATRRIRSTCPVRNEGALIREGKALGLLIAPQYMWGVYWFWGKP